MTGHVFKREQFLPLTIDEAWDFFSSPRNLSRITPPSLDFKIVSNVPSKIYDGLEIEYRVRPLLGLPVAWISRIQDVQPPYQFVDVQLKGPYRYWHHHHHFEAAPSGVLMRDTITYNVPFGTLVPWLNDALVVKELNRIFDFRQGALEKLFGYGRKGDA